MGGVSTFGPIWSVDSTFLRGKSTKWEAVEFKELVSIVEKESMNIEDD